MFEERVVGQVTEGFGMMGRGARVGAGGSGCSSSCLGRHLLPQGTL